MKLSIIIPTYNSDQTLQFLLDSFRLYTIMNETEFIFIDNSSSDQTSEMILEFCKISNTIIISEPDNGIYDAMNKGVLIAKGDYFYFIGADDELLPDFKSVYKYLNKKAIYYGNVILKNKNEIYDGRFDSHKLSKKNICHQSILYHKSVFDEQLYDLKFPVFSDYVLNLKLWNDKEFPWKYLNLNLAMYNSNGFSSKNIDSQFDLSFSNLKFEMFSKRTLLKKVIEKLNSIKGNT